MALSRHAFIDDDFSWNIPTPLTSFVGREQDVSAVCALLRRPEIRLLTLLGTGGIGKTRLGLRVADEMQDYFRDGVRSVSLVAVNEPERVLPALAETLGLPEMSGQSVLAQVAFFLRDRHMLLLLDNFEQVKEAAFLLEDLLAPAPLSRCWLRPARRCVYTPNTSTLCRPCLCPRWTDYRRPSRWRSMPRSRSLCSARKQSHPRFN